MYCRFRMQRVQTIQSSFIYICSLCPQIIRQRLLVSSTQLITWICGFMISQLVNLFGWLLKWLAKCSAVTFILDTIQNFEYMWISNSFGLAVEHILKKEGVVELIVMVFCQLWNLLSDFLYWQALVSKFYALPNFEKCYSSLVFGKRYVTIYFCVH